HDGERGDALAAAGFADDAQRLAGKHVERDAVDRIGHALDGEEMGAQVADAEQRIGHGSNPHMRRARRGSRRSRKPSPNRLTESTTRASATPGAKIVHGARPRKSRLWAIMLPQVGMSGGVPAPRNDSAASIKIADAMM